MANKPSQRRNFQEEEMELNLTPIMNLIMLLIPCLLISTVFIEITVVNVSAPSIGSGDPSAGPQEPPEKPPLNLTVTVTSKGYTVAGSGGVLGAQKEAGEEQKGPTIPIREMKINCTNYLGTVPPPKKKNADRSPCSEAEVSAQVLKTFWAFDNEALTKKLVEIKEAYPDEVRIIISSEQDISYEAIIDIMDASREIKDEESGEKRELFPEVVISPGFI